jgi:transducin (beta)-like 1
MLIPFDEKGPIFATRFSKSGRWLLTASLDGTACLWDVREKILQMQYRCHTGNMDIIIPEADANPYNPDCCLDVVWINENMFASCGADQLIYVMDVYETNPVKTLS